MNIKNILILLAIVNPIAAKELQQLADNLTVPSTVFASSKQLSMPTAEGAQVRILGADYKLIITADGKINPVISNTTVEVSFELSQGDKKAISRDYSITVCTPSTREVQNPKPTVIPSLLQWKGGIGNFSLPSDRKTTISGNAAAELDVEIEAVCGKQAEFITGKQADITLRLNKDLANRLGKEGYELCTTEAGVSIMAATQTGLYWGTRSLLQILKQSGGVIPCGTALDFPRYPLRGFMLDVGRVPIPMNYLDDIVETMAWYKMNDFQIHLNDNYIFHEQYVDMGKDPFKESYAGFRLESNVKGKDGTPLTSEDLSYSKKDFVKFIKSAKVRGVQITPEIDTPGHALAFTRVRPDLIYQGPMGGKEKRRCEMLDASRTETLDFVTSVFDEYLLNDEKLGQPIFEGCPVHIGSDEFYGQAEDYRKFTNGLLKHVASRGYTPRVWGSLGMKPGKTPVLAKGVQINLWNGGWAGAWDSINQGYDVINTNDGALYIVPFANYYRMDKNMPWVYNHWETKRIADNVLPAGHPQLLGSMFAVWNDQTDRRHPGYHYEDLRPSINHAIDVLGQRMWSPKLNPRDYKQHGELVSKLGHSPVPSNLPTIKKEANYLNGQSVIALNEGLIAPPYRFEMDLELDAQQPKGNIPLISAGDAMLYVNGENGEIEFVRDDTLRFSFRHKMPLGKRVKLELVGTLGKTELYIDGKLVEAPKSSTPAQAAIAKASSANETVAGVATAAVADSKAAATVPELLSFKSVHELRISTFPLPLDQIGNEQLKGKIYRSSLQRIEKKD